MIQIRMLCLFSMAVLLAAISPWIFQPTSVKAQSSTSLFGYEMDDACAYDWEDVTSGGGYSVFTGGDEGYVKIPIGFTFPFYEGTFSNLYLDTNGILEISDPKGTQSTNYPIPADYAPNHLIAVLWDDLSGSYAAGNDGKILFKKMTSPDRLVVTYNQVWRVQQPAEKITFQAVLYTTGDIKMQYQTISGDMDNNTVGIEDRDGIDGLQYTYNEDRLSSGKCILLSYPTSSPRLSLKAGPVYQGNFLALYQSYFSVTVYNTGTVADTYNLQAIREEGADWDVAFYDLSGVNPLTDTNGDWEIDTGPIDPLHTATFLVRIKASETTTQIGDYELVRIDATSPSSLKTASVRVQSALPAPFALTFTDQQIGMNVQFFTPRWRFTRNVPSSIQGDNFGLERVTPELYCAVWENYPNIHYSLLSFDPLVSTRLFVLQNNTGSASDYFPSVAATPDGQYFGIVYVHQSSVFPTSGNIYLAIYEDDGNLASGFTNPIKITNNVNVSRYDKPPRLSATGDNHFTMAYIESQGSGNTLTSNLGLAIYSTDGTQIYKSNLSPASSAPNGRLYTHPALTDLSGNRTLVSYAVDDRGASTFHQYYRIINSSGTETLSETSITSYDGGPSDAVELSNSNLLLAWSENQNRIVYTVLDANGSEISAPNHFPTPSGRTSDRVSVTRDLDGHGILTWSDNLINSMLFYGLVDGENGDILTPAMILRMKKPSATWIKTNSAGLGNARLTEQLIIQYLFFPVVEREP